MILVAGSVLVERLYRTAALPAGEGSAKAVAMCIPGGLGAVEALAALRDGATLRLLAALGQDGDARMLREFVHQQGIDAEFVTCPDAPTGSAATIQEDSGCYVRAVALAANSLMDAGDSDRLLGGVSLLLCQCEANHRASGLLMARARERGIRSVLHASPARPDALRALCPLADLVVAGAEELSAIVGTFIPAGTGDYAEEQIHALPDAKLGAMCRRIPCPESVLILGARGVLVSTADGAGKLLSDPRYPVGLQRPYRADEAFVGALCSRLDAGESLRSASRYALAAASLLGSMGGNDAIPRRQDILACLEELGE